MMTGYKEEEGRALRGQVGDALATRLPEVKRNHGDFIGRHCRIEISFGRGFTRVDFTVVSVKVAPDWSLSARPSIFRLKVESASDESIATLVEKAVAKFQEFERQGEATAQRIAEGEQRKAIEDKQISAFMALRFPEFHNDYDRKYSREDEYDFHLHARIEDGSVSFKVKLDGYVSAEDAREIADLLAKVRARKAQQASAGSGDL